jgi:uncharacterized membrane protein YecN with MAPEG domain
MTLLTHSSIALLYGSVVLLLVGGLGARVSMLRGQKNTYIGGNPDEQLLRAIRAHGNAIEYAPLQLLILLAMEWAGASSVLLHVFGGLIVLVRALHAAGVLSKTPLSVVGATLNYLLCIGMAGYGLVLHFR